MKKEMLGRIISFHIAFLPDSIIPSPPSVSQMVREGHIRPRIVIFSMRRHSPSTYLQLNKFNIIRYS